MTGHKQFEKSLKRPDSFQDHILKGITFATKNKKQIMMMISPILVVALIGYGVYGWMNHKAAARRTELAKILALQTEEQNNVGKKREEIQKEIDALRTTKPAADGKKVELSAESLAKVTVLEKQMTDLKADNSKSTAEFRKFYDNNKDSPEGWMAGLAWSSKQLQDNKSAEARPLVEAIAKASTANKFYQLSSRFMLIGILEDAGEYDAAIKECETLAGITTDDAKPAVLLAKGRLQYFKKSLPEARTSLNEVIEKHASAPEATKARGIIALMGPA